MASAACGTGEEKSQTTTPWVKEKPVEGVAADGMADATAEVKADAKVTKVVPAEKVAAEEVEEDVGMELPASISGVPVTRKGPPAREKPKGKNR